MAIQTGSHQTPATEAREQEAANYDGPAADILLSSDTDSCVRSMSWGSAASTASHTALFLAPECLTCYSSEDADVNVGKVKGQRRVRFSDVADEVHEISPRALEAKWGAASSRTLDNFLVREGFTSGVNGRRRWLCRTTYPLHVACKQGYEKMVELLLASGADATLRDSERRTPAEVAKRYDCNGSHDAVLRALGND
mmetsp:Transcript_63447/g.163272  ORF Transcript_63447/g.163272 Transcript_63447/m.163272 type:complete len:197 (+) Transcript_63447:142-732(+)